MEGNIVLLNEVIFEFDVDYIILFLFNGIWEEESNVKVFEDMKVNLLWKIVLVFKNGYVYLVERLYWQMGVIMVNGLKMDDLF